MRWIRSNIRLGSRLALFALAVQILLSFSHIDVCGLIGGGAVAIAQADQKATNDHRAPARTDDRGCPICALIQLASTSTPTTPPALPAPTLLGPRKLEVAAVATLAALPPAGFRARAPPAA